MSACPMPLGRAATPQFEQLVSQSQRPTPQARRTALRRTGALVGRLSVCLLALASAPGIATAQLPQAKLLAVFPTGGQAGTSVDLSLTNGQDLEDVAQLWFSHPGIVAVAKRQEVEGNSELLGNQFTVSIASDVPPGAYEVCAVSVYGISNPRTFVVSGRPERQEAEPNNAPGQATPIELNQVINGRVNGATDIDLFSFSGRAGQRIIAECLARQIDSRLDPLIELYDHSRRRLASARNTVRRDAVLDAVLPADGTYVLKLTDFVYAGGEDYPYRLQVTDGPYLDGVVPAAVPPGATTNVLLIGRNLPGGEATPLQWRGRQLQQLTGSITAPAEQDLLRPALTLDSTASTLTGFAYSLPTPVGPSTPVNVFYATEPVTVEQESAEGKPQLLQPPVDVTGRFQSRADVDVYEFEAKTGQVWSIEVLGQRMGYSTDPFLVLDQVVKNDQGVEQFNRLLAVDDSPINPIQPLFDVGTDDPAVRWTAPADGKYRVTLRDRYSVGRGDASLIYRLVIRQERPGFRAFAVPVNVTPPGPRTPVPWSVSLRRGEQALLAVGVLRTDGFDGPVTISAVNLPPGLSCRDVTIGTAPASGVIVLSAAEDAPAFYGNVSLQAKGQVRVPGAADGATQELVLPVRAGTVLWNGQQNVPADSRLSGLLPVSIVEEAAPFEVLTPVHVVAARHGTQILVPLQLKRRGPFVEAVNLQFFDVPPNLQVENKPIPKEKTDELLRCFVPNNVPAGTYVMYLSGQAQVPYRRNPAKAELRQQQFAAVDQLLKQANDAVTAASTTREQANQKVTELGQSVQAAASGLASAQQELAAAQGVLTAAMEAVSNAAQAGDTSGTAEANRDQAQTQVQAAQAKVDAATAAVTTTEAEAKAAAEALAAAEAALKAAQESVTAVTARRTAAEQRMTQQNKASEQQNLNYQPPGPAIVLVIKPAPVTLTATPANGGMLKPGEKLEIKVDLQRINNFAGPVDVEATFPPGVTGLTSNRVTIPADQTTGTVVVEAAADAPAQQPPHVAIRATAEFDGPAHVDQNFPLQVVP